MKSRLGKLVIYIRLFWKRSPERKEKRKGLIKRPFLFTAVVLIILLTVGVLVYITESESVLRLSIWVNLVFRPP